MTRPKKRRASDDRPKKRRASDEEQEGPEGKNVPSEFLAHRLEGGAPASPEAYAHAVEQWQQLSGAVLSGNRISPTLLRPDTTKSMHTKDIESDEDPL